MKKHFKQLLSMALAAAMCLLLPAVYINAADCVFEDIQGHWAQNDIECMYNAGMISGVSETEFAPDEIITKAELVTMVVRALGIEENYYSTSFSDVSPVNDWFAGYVGGAVEAGIIDNSANSFYPDASITRADAAKLLYKAVEYSEIADGTAISDSVTYSDVSSEDTELTESVAVLSTTGIMVGVSETEFAPEETLTRAETASLVIRMVLSSDSLTSTGLSFENAEMSNAEITDGSVTLTGDEAYVAIDSVLFTYSMNSMEVMASASAEDMQLEVWIDSMDTMTGTKLGTIELEVTGASFLKQRCLINRTTGSHKVYLRLLGTGSVTLSSAQFKVDEIVISCSDYTKLSLFKHQNGVFSNLVYRGYAQFWVYFGEEGYDTVELTMKNTTAGQLLEIWLNDVKCGIVETIDAGDEEVTVEAPVANVNNTHDLLIKPATDVDGSITNIRFYNKTSKADLYIPSSEQSSVEVAESSDYDKGPETEVLKDGDVIKFAGVNFGDGYNIMTMRIQDAGIVNSTLTLTESGETTAELLGFDTQNKNAYIEVRLDSPDGALAGKMTRNPIDAYTVYDNQNCYLNGASGTHDVYLRVVGDIGWRLRYLKLRERGVVNLPFVQLEAEDMIKNLAQVNDPNDPDSYKAYTIANESSGKSTVKISQSGGYVEFKIPEYFEGGENRVAIKVRHCITDDGFEEIAGINDLISKGQDGAMRVSVNGEERKILDSHAGMAEQDAIVLTSKNNRHYIGKEGKGLDDGQSRFYYNDAEGIVSGLVSAGDTVRLTPEINEKVTYCYIDLVDIELIPEAKKQPEGYLSITDCGAVPNDGEDDAIALRNAVDTVNADPDTYRGIWIPEGTFDMKKYKKYNWNTAAADFSGLRVLGAGPWYSKLVSYYNDLSYVGWTPDYRTGNNTVLRDFAIFADETYIREFAVAYGSRVGLWGSGSHFISNMWFESTGACTWLYDANGVFDNNRIYNTWADGFNLNCDCAGVIYINNYLRGTGDDALALFADSREKSSRIHDAKIKNNTTHCNWTAAGVDLWGGDDIVVENNLIVDSAAFGIAMHSAIGAAQCPMPNDIWIKNNTLIHCGEKSDLATGRGAIFIVSSIQQGDSPYVTVTKMEDVYVENNEFLDNPYAFFVAFANGNRDDINPEIRYNYIRNVGIAVPGDEYLTSYSNGVVQGNIEYSYNVFEGKSANMRKSYTNLVNEYLNNNIPASLWNKEEEVLKP